MKKVKDFFRSISRGSGPPAPDISSVPVSVPTEDPEDMGAHPDPGLYQIFKAGFKIHHEAFVFQVFPIVTGLFLPCTFERSEQSC